MRKFVAAAGVALALSACSKQDVGALAGAGIGGLAGAQFGKGEGQLVATGIGVLLGALAGGAVGAELDAADRVIADAAFTGSLETAPTGTTTEWSNPDSGASGTYTPIATTQTASGQYCREFQQTITIGGQTENAHGRACRQPDGTWRVAQ